ncbi:hypothetical protein KQX54_020045 [Cotesia glomerata]|uniref:Uncharacterized protein n=1 Tax=Cotesia glomerata TaxID=32391 RepID=A0AAV7IDT3_COTGL|nr:hypothetical protein KQX54_020045 [Cotesia glomerata]
MKTVMCKTRNRDKEDGGGKESEKNNISEWNRNEVPTSAEGEESLRRDVRKRVLRKKSAEGRGEGVDKVQVQSWYLECSIEFRMVA